MLELLKAMPVLAVAFIVWVTQRDILRSQQSTNRKLARIESRQVGDRVPVRSPAFGVPIPRQDIRARTTADSDDPPNVPRTNTEDLDGGG